jgi:hypothetical protein
VYSRACLSRTVALVVALFLTAISTSVVAREFRAADTHGEDYPTVQALRYMGRSGAIDLNRTNVALIGTFVPMMNVLAMPLPFCSIEHLQKVLDGPIVNEIPDSFAAHGFVGRKVE